MEQSPLNKYTPTNPQQLTTSQDFISNIESKQELIQKELSVNQSEQLLLLKRIETMKGLINELPRSDPQYGALLIQIEMDQVELSELKMRESYLKSS